MANDSWKHHDIYSEDVSCNRIVSRSQTAFLRLKNTGSDLNLFCDKDKHQPATMPHLINTLKGHYGAVPRTIITRSMGKHIPVSEELCEKVDLYKHEEKEKESSGKPKRKVSVFDKLKLF